MYTHEAHGVGLLYIMLILYINIKYYIYYVICLAVVCKVSSGLLCVEVVVVLCMLRH